MRRLLSLLLLLGIATLPRLAFAEEVKVLFERPAPFTTDVRWFPDGRHLLLAHCAGEFGEKEEGNLPYGVCRFLVFDTRTKRSIPVKRASSRGDWQDPNLLHLAVADGSNCLWAVSPGGELFIRALPEGVAPDGLRMEGRGLWVVTISAQGFYLYRYDPQSDRYYEVGSYDYGEDPLNAFLIIKIDGDLPEGTGRRGGPLLIPLSNPYSTERDLALVWDADYVPFEGFYDGPRYEEVSLIRTSVRQRLYRVGGDRVLVSFGWDPRPGQRRLALLVAPRNPEGVFDPRRRRLVVLEVAAAGEPPGPSHTGSQTLINFDPSDYTPGACR